MIIRLELKKFMLIQLDSLKSEVQIEEIHELIT